VTKYGEEYEGRKFETTFVGADIPPSSVVETISSIGAALNDAGLTPENAGNISVRSKAGMFITVGGVNKGELTGADVAEVIDFDFHTAKVVGAKEPSSETPMHWLIYHSYPDADAIVHVHDDLAVDAADKLRRDCGICATESFANYGTEEQAHQVVEALSHCQYAIIRGHGVICIGETLKECLSLILNVHRSLSDSIKS
jgi:L-fuculose-phosphate aldolase